MEKASVNLSVTADEMQQLQSNAKRAAQLLHTLSNEHRLIVLCQLVGAGEMSVGQLLQCVPLSQSALSQHLAKMREEGLVTYRREAQTVYYRIADANIVQILATLKQIFCP